MDVDRLDRTLKLELDEGRAASLPEADKLARSYVLGIVAGAGIAGSPTRQALLLTMLNAGSRAFFGGTKVRVDEDFVFDVSWAKGRALTEVLRRYGASPVRQLPTTGSRPVIIGEPSEPSEGLHPTWEGWSAGIVLNPGARLAETMEFVLSGVLAGALAVSECFQQVRGFAPAADRSFGLSLWRPELSWQATEAFGPPLEYLPSRLWLLGLGHLGQAYCWALGLLPYRSPAEAEVLLQDYDYLVRANTSTGLLSTTMDVGRRKTRLVSDRLEALGFKTTLTERPYNEHTCRSVHEPGLALAGFDRPEPRRLLEGAGFDYVIDMGLGRGSRQYLDLTLHCFPSGLGACDAFAVSDTGRAPGENEVERPAYERLIQKMVAKDGISEGDARCGALEIAGRSVGAAFVGAAAATVALAEVLRILHDGPRYQVVDVSLRSPEYLEVASNERPGPPVNPGYVPAV